MQKHSILFSLFLFQVLGRDPGPLHPQPDRPDGGRDDPADLADVHRGLAGAAARMEGLRLRGQGQRGEELHGEIVINDQNEDFLN